MNINNFTEFYNLVHTSGLSTISPFNNFMNTVDQYLNLCQCDKPHDKAIKLMDAKTQYVGIVNGQLSSYIPQLKSKNNVTTISFYNGGPLIRTY